MENSIFNTSYLIFYLDIISPLVALISGTIFFYSQKRKLVYADYLIVYFLICEIVLNDLATISMGMKVNNQWLYHLNCLLIETIFTLYFLKTLNRKKIILFGFFMFAIFWLINIIWIQKYDAFNSYSYALGALILVLNCLLSFHELITNMPTEKILSLKNFWILTGILTYFGSCFFIFMSYNYLSGIDAKNVGILWRLHNVFLALVCLIFLKAMACKQWIPK